MWKADLNQVVTEETAPWGWKFGKGDLFGQGDLGLEGGLKGSQEEPGLVKRSRGCVCPRPATSLCPLTFLASFLPGSVNVVLELDADLPLGGLVADERELEQLLRRWAAQVSLDETRVNEVDELLRPGNDGGSHWEGPLGRGVIPGGRGESTLTSLLSPPYPNTRLLAPQLQCRPRPPPLLWCRPKPGCRG